MAQLPKPIPIMQLLAELQGGGLMVDIADNYQKVIAAVHASGKKGKLVIELNFTKVSEFNHTVAATVKATIPRPAVMSDTKFHDGAGNSYNTDPKQFNMHDELAPRRMGVVGGTDNTAPPN